MKIFFSLLFYFFIVEHEGKKLMKFRHHHKKFKSTDPLYIDKDKWELQEKKNQAAEEIFADHNQRNGRDLINSESLSGTYYVVAIDKNPNPEKASENEGVPEFKMITINTHTLSIYTSEVFSIFYKEFIQGN